jgi:hypothetical protein
VVALPEEPWFHDKAERRDECVPPLSTTPSPHFAAPFDRCDTRSESFTSPPGGTELHFHYRAFSAGLTLQTRSKQPAVCCYMIYEFPR